MLHERGVSVLVLEARNRAGGRTCTLQSRPAHPLDGTLFFAGEAACPDDAGIVAGASESGYDAAQAVLKSR
jgi:monoamine oxidase